MQHLNPGSCRSNQLTKKRVLNIRENIDNRTEEERPSKQKNHQHNDQQRHPPAFKEARTAAFGESSVYIDDNFIKHI